MSVAKVLIHLLMSITISTETYGLLAWKSFWLPKPVDWGAQGFGGLRQFAKLGSLVGGCNKTSDE